MDGDAIVLSGKSTAPARDGRPPRRPRAGRDPLARRAEDLVGLVKEMKDEPAPRVVHRLRTTIRRLETLLPDASVATGAERKVRKQLDRIRQRAGKVRDVDVHLSALRTLPRTLEVEARAALRSDLRKARVKRQKRLVRVLGDERDRGLVKRLRRVVGRTPAVEHVAADADRVLTEVLADFATTYAAAQPLTAANLHEFRIATKRLRYRAEALAPHANAAVAERALKRAQDAIGSWHDWLTLGERAAAVAETTASPLLDAIGARTEAELAKALTVAERVARRLAAIGGPHRRKGVHPVAAEPVGAPKLRAGASA